MIERRPLTDNSTHDETKQWRALMESLRRIQRGRPRLTAAQAQAVCDAFDRRYGGCHVAIRGADGSIRLRAPTGREEVRARRDQLERLINNGPARATPTGAASRPGSKACAGPAGSLPDLNRLKSATAERVRQELQAEAQERFRRWLA